MNDVEEFVHRLLAKFPELDDLYQAHLENNGCLLEHVFFGDIRRETVQAFLGASSDISDWQRLLSFLETAYQRGDKGVKDVIGTSFLYDLPWPGEPGHEIADHLGPVLTETYERVRSS